MPVKTQTSGRTVYETLVIEAWVKDYRIGWITATFFYLDQDPVRHFNDLTAVSAVIKTRKLFANYNGNPLAFSRVGGAAIRGDYSETKKWVEDQWTGMLTKAGII